MELTSPGCPVQFEGKLKDGTYFYFRERHDWTSFTISTSPKKAIRGKKPKYHITLPDRHYPDSAAKQISKWVDDYFHREEEEKELMNKVAK